MSSEYVKVFLNSNNYCSSTAYTQRGETAVYNASAQGHSEVVKLLVQAGADLELQPKVYTLWERFMLAHAVYDIVFWNEAMTIINV